MAARAYAEALHDQAMLLGYNVGVNFGMELGKEGSAVSFWVRRVDQPSGTERTFATTAEVDEYLAHVATFRRYSLELENNPRITVSSDSDGTATWITDTRTGERFGIRTADLENLTQLSVHAETPPTIGNWS
ncbi:hypothetical protein A5714_11610 [Mycobacterium sp. E2462]|nr:hypothetical protein A5714_11610 [Mycobacterium sp. E2462]